jgi:hypothetical protein
VANSLDSAVLMPGLYPEYAGRLMPIAGSHSVYVMYCCSAITTRRAIWNLSSSDNEAGSRPTIRLCSRARSVCVAVRNRFSFARTSPATIALAGLARRIPSTSIGGAVDALPRALARGR